MLTPIVIILCVLTNLSWAGKQDNDYMREQLHGLTRWTNAGDTTSSNWFDYTLFECEGGEKNRSCSAATVEASDVYSEDASEDSVALYAQGVATYAIVNFVAAALIIAGTFLFLIAKLCSLCCRKPDHSVKPHPMLNKSSRMLVSMGCLSIVMMFLFVVIILGMTLGFGEKDQVYTSAPNAPIGATSILRGEIPVVESLVISFSSAVVAATLTRVNTSFVQALDLPQTLQDLEDINRTVSNFPPVSEIRGLTSSLETNTDQSIVIIDQISADIVEVDGQLSSFKSATAKLKTDLVANALNTQLTTDLDDLEAAYGAVSLVAIRRSVSELQVNMEPTGGYIDDLAALVDTLDTLLADLLPPLDDLFNTQISGVNDTLVDTNQFFDSTDLFDDFNTSIHDALFDTSGIDAELQAAKVSLQAVNFSDYLLTIDTANRTITESAADANFTVMRTAFQYPNYGSFIDVNDYVGRLDDVITSIDDVDLTDIQSTLDTSKGDLGSIDFNTFDAGLNEYDTLIGESKDFVLDGLLLVGGMHSFLYDTDQLKLHRDQLSSPYLMVLAEELGTGAVLISIATTFDRMTGYFSNLLNNVTYLNISEVDSTHLADDVRDFAQSLDRMSARRAPFITPYTIGGPLYYLTQLMNSTRDKSVNLNDPQADLILMDADGKRYEDDKFCVTRDCFTNQEEEDSSGTGAYGISTETALGLLFLPLWLIFAAGSCGAVVSVYAHRVGHSNRCRNCPLHCMLFLIIFFVPLLFLMSGIVMPLLLVGSDGCEGGVSGTTALYLDSYGSEALCDQWGGSGTLNNCVMSGGALDLNVNVDYRTMIDTLTGYSYDALRCSSGGDPFISVLQQVIDQLPDTLSEKAGNFTEKQEFKTDLANIINIAADDLGGVLSQFLESTKTHLNCESVAAIPSNLYEPVCGDVVGVYGWLFGTIYLACWVLFCCGIPAGCFSLHASYEDYLEEKYEESFNEGHDHDFCDASDGNQSDRSDLSDDGNQRSQHLFQFVPTAPAQAVPIADDHHDTNAALNKVVPYVREFKGTTHDDGEELDFGVIYNSQKSSSML